MSTEENKIIQDAASEAGTFHHKTSRDAMSTALKTLKKSGMQHNTLADAEMARIREAGHRQIRQGSRRGSGQGNDRRSGFCPQVILTIYRSVSGGRSPPVPFVGCNRPQLNLPGV
jgi:hypothetical protein